MKSDFAYERIVSENKLYEYKRIDSLEGIQDCIQYYKPDIVVLDNQINYLENAVKLLLRFNILIIYFDGDFERVVEDIRTQSIFFKDSEPEYKKYIPDHARFLKDVEREVPIEEGPKVIYQEKIIEKEIERIHYTTIPTKIVLVGSLYRGAGATLVASNLALALAKRKLDTTFIEYPLNQNPYIFDYLQIYARESEEKPFTDTIRELSEQGAMWASKEAWVDKNVKWHVIDTRKEPQPTFSYEHLSTLTKAMPTSYLIIDVSNNWLNPELQKYLYLADEILICMDTDPIQLQKSIETPGEFKTKEARIIESLFSNPKLKNVEVVQTKVFKNGVLETKELLPKNPLIKVPYIPFPSVQKSLYETSFLYEVQEYSEVIEDAFYPLFKKIVPREFMEVEERKTKLSKRLLPIYKRKKEEIK